MRYVVPHRVTCRASGPLDLYFRVNNVYKPASVAIYSGSERIKAYKRAIVTPGEMEKVTVDAGLIAGDVTISIEEG